MQFEDQRDNESIGQWRSLLPVAEQADVFSPMPPIAMSQEAHANLNNIASNVINTTEHSKTNFRGV